MGVIDIASSKSVWRGMEYYKQNNLQRRTAQQSQTRQTEQQEAASIMITYQIRSWKANH